MAKNGIFSGSQWLGPAPAVAQRCPFGEILLRPVLRFNEANAAVLATNGIYIQ